MILDYSETSQYHTVDMLIPLGWFWTESAGSSAFVASANMPMVHIRMDGMVGIGVS